MSLRQPKMVKMCTGAVGLLRKVLAPAIWVACAFGAGATQTEGRNDIVAPPALYKLEDNLNIHVSLGQRSVQTQFFLINRSPNPVHIKGVRTDCSCTHAVATNETIQPGGDAIISASFDTAGREGVQSHVISVYTDEPIRLPYELHVQLDLPTAPTIQPRAVLWRANHESAKTQVLVTAPAGQTMDLQSATVIEGRAKVSVETIKAGSVYRLILIPSSGAFTDILKLSLSCTSGQVDYFVHLRAL